MNWKVSCQQVFGVVTLVPALLSAACGADTGPSPASPSGGAAGTPTSGSGGTSMAPGGGAGSAPVAPGSSGASSVGGVAGSGNAGGTNGGGGASGGGAAGSAGNATAGGGTAGSGGLDPSWCQVAKVPDDLREDWEVDAYYQKYSNANGIPILTSNAPPDNAIVLACKLVVEMVSKRDDVRKALIDNHVHFTVIGEKENTNDVPEYAYLDDSINTRARGLGGVPGMCAEESILCGASDRWRGESICVHEFAHTISLYGVYDADPTFEDRLIKAFQNAKSAGKFANTYAMENEQEYWGEIVQDWYYTNLESTPANGVHNSIDTREELLAADPAGYALVKELLSEDVSWDDCYRDD